MTILRILLGAVMLTAGRNLFWLFLGGTGFILGFDLAGRLLHSQPHGVIFVIAVIAGLGCALLAILLQKVAILAAGFFAGGYLLPAVLKEFGVRTVHYYWMLFIVGAVAGALFMKVFFTWALIVFSSVLGSSLVVGGVHLGPRLGKVLFVFLLLLGIIIQAGMRTQRNLPRSPS